MSLRGAFAATWQSPVRGDCFAIARNDMQVSALRELRSASGEELRPLFGRTLMPSILDKAFKREL
jgi:hypothetical protein